MRSILAMVVLIGCSTNESIELDLVQFDGPVPANVDTAQLSEDFLASGAMFGVSVDPMTGDVLTMQNTDRAVNSGDFSIVTPAVCDDCGGVNATCTGPAGFQRQISIGLQRNTGSGAADVAYLSPTNWTPIGQNCNGAVCPDPDVDASGGPTAFDVVLFGNLGSCSAFNVFFDTDDGVVGGGAESVTTTLAPPVGISDLLPPACADLPIPGGAGVVDGDMTVDVTMSHSWIGDIQIQLTDPSATTATMLERPGRTGGAGAGDSSVLSTASPIQFLDGGTFDAELMGATVGGTGVVCGDDGECDFFTNPDELGGPASFAAAFDGVAASGNWQLCVTDNAGGDDGTLDEVTLSFSTL